MQVALRMMSFNRVNSSAEVEGFGLVVPNRGSVRTV